jgi:hypothetical protein
MGIFDQDVDDKVSLAVPQLYKRGIERLEWSQTKFWYATTLLFFYRFTNWWQAIYARRLLPVRHVFLYAISPV